VFRALTSLFQLSLPFLEERPPRTADELLSRLRSFGLRRTDRIRLTRNRSVMVSYRAGALRLHRAFLDAPPDVLRAVATFVDGRTRAQRAAAHEGGERLTLDMLHAEFALAMQQCGARSLNEITPSYVVRA